MVNLMSVAPGRLEQREWAPLIEGLDSARVEGAGADALPGDVTLVLLPPSGGRSWEDARGAAVRALAEALDGIAPEAVKHQPSNAEGQRRIRVIVLSSMRATGATERSAGFAAEDQPSPSSDREARSWRRYEKSVAKHAQRAGAVAVVLRCSFIDGVRNRSGSMLQGSTVFSWFGFDPPVQVLPVDKLLYAIRALHAATVELPPVLHAAPDDAVPLSIWLRSRGQRRVPIPGWFHSLASRLGGTPVEQRRAVQRPMTLDNALLKSTLGLEEFGRMAPADAPYDGFGWKATAVDRFGRWAMEPLRRAYWRVSDAGADRVPTEGPALLVGIHRGYVPLDAMMLLHLVRRRAGRTVRFLIHPALVRLPVLANFLPSIGGLVASARGAERVLGRGGMVGVFPEGADAAMVETSRAYPLRPFLSDEFARWAVRWNAPVVPVALVGPAEALPIFRRVRWRWWRRNTGWPTFPIGFLFPFGPPIPLPTKWHILFLEPIRPEDFEHEDEGERARALAQAVRDQLDHAVRDLVRRRRSVWRGALDETAQDPAH